MGILRTICESLRSEVDERGAAGCYKKSVQRYHRMTGLDILGLWAVVDGVLRGDKEDKLLKRIHKTYGGDPNDWAKWLAVSRTKPDC